MTESAAVGMLAGILGISLIIAVIFYILVVIACWKIFKKAGEPGWKSIIPIYNEYMLFKMFWKPSMFWITVLLAFLAGILMQFNGGATTGVYSYLAFIGCLLAIAAYIINCFCFFKAGVAFGHGIPFFIFALILPNIALLYLGFSKDEYRGNNARF